jgi:hypothetical protein
MRTPRMTSGIRACCLLVMRVARRRSHRWFCFGSTDIIHQDVEPTPLLLNAIDDVLDTTGRSEIRLHKESRSLAWSWLRSRGGGDRGTAQCEAAYNRFSYTLRATGHENTFAFEVITKTVNG